MSYSNLAMIFYKLSYTISYSFQLARLEISDHFMRVPFTTPSTDCCVLYSEFKNTTTYANTDKTQSTESCVLCSELQNYFHKCRQVFTHDQVQ